jgi:hypothetical protein
MRAMAVDQAVAAFFVAKQHQIFAQQLDGFHRARSLKLVHQRRRLPVHPHQFPAGVLRPGAGDQVVLLPGSSWRRSPGSGHQTILFVY